MKPGMLLGLCIFKTHAPGSLWCRLALPSFDGECSRTSSVPCCRTLVDAASFTPVTWPWPWLANIRRLRGGGLPGWAGPIYS